MKLEVKKIGNSTGLILPRELLNELKGRAGPVAARDTAPGRRGAPHPL